MNIQMNEHVNGGMDERIFNAYNGETIEITYLERIR